MEDNTKQQVDGDIKESLHFYCIAREDGNVPCDVQCITCLKKSQDNE